METKLQSIYLLSEQEAQSRFHAMEDKALGRFGEALWSAIFKASDIDYIPLCRIEDGGAPKLSGKVVLPDFDVIGKTWSAYVDSKAKTTSVVWRKTDEERHGIDRKNYAQYQRVAAIGRKDCGLGIVELWRESTSAWSGALLIESLSELDMPRSGESNQRHMVYWPRKRFRDLNSFTAGELYAFAKGYLLPPSFAFELERIFNPIKQKEFFP